MSLNSNSETDGGDGSCMKTVHMHMPNRQARNYIDALLAFWPGLQVLKGDIKEAIKFHEQLHQIVKKHDFLPEAVLFDHSVHWSNHPLRPEFLESTYYLYKATKDDYYLEIAKKMINQLENYSRVRCGYAAIADVKTKQQDDRMDSFVFAETFKYLYLLFTEDENIIFDIEDFIFSTEAHLLPLKIDDYIEPRLRKQLKPKSANNQRAASIQRSSWRQRTCPNLSHMFGTKKSQKKDMSSIIEATKKIRDSVSFISEKQCDRSTKFDAESLTSFNFNSKTSADLNSDKFRQLPLRAVDFNSGRKDHLDILHKMGIKLTTMEDGRLQLVHKTNDALTFEDAELGILFMTEMLELSKQQKYKANTVEDEYKPISIIIMSRPFQTSKIYLAGPAQFGYNLRKNVGIFGKLIIGDPFDACKPLKNPQTSNKIILVKRGNCIFIEKVRNVENAGGIGVIIIDNADDTSYSTSPLFAMSGDGVQDVKIPSVFLFGKEGNDLLWNLRSYQDMIVYLGDTSGKCGMSGPEYAMNFNTEQLISVVTDIHSDNSRHFLQIINSYVNVKKTECFPNEYVQLKEFFDLYYIAEKISTKTDILVSNSIKSIISIDDVIAIGIGQNDQDRQLILDVESLESIARNISDQNTSKHALTVKVFDLLLSRLKERTNFFKLKKYELYSKALFNFINSHFNPKSNKLSDQDQFLIIDLAKNLNAVD